MAKFAITLLISAAAMVVISGCASSGQSPEQQTRESDQQRDAERQQAEFRKGLPPVTNPGQGY